MKQLRWNEVMPIGGVHLQAQSSVTFQAYRELMSKALPSFRGRSAREAMNAIAAGENLQLSEGLVRKLVDFELLVPPAYPPIEYSHW